ncbi:BspA family leucine-rich repeat surface protein [Mycoplasma mycoides]|uniref:BspA family leucine-rich repeat surface protein n=1 Tax=Mycoplasma mycoides TaxID=2102 RepID=UPI002ACE71D7|nr:BspA family leucine-rich repeat surface protein [Mycoplasma mycoides]QVK06981.1 BspA family leucine-rich repeat surface protein [Mycoplasma mycoides subsp. capri]
MLTDNPILNIDFIEDGDIKQIIGISLSDWQAYRKQNKDSKIEVKSWAVWKTPAEELYEKYKQVAKQYFESNKNKQHTEETEEIPDKKEAIYNADKTECLEIGYFKNEDGQIQIEPFPETIKKVPKVLPKQITSLKNAFENNINITISGIEHWDVSNVTDTSYMFAFSSFNQDISNWNTSNVINMNGMFFGAKNFDEPISNWDVSNVTDMSFMFFRATSFNQDISNWNTSNVINMNGMFFGAKNFDEPISNWDVSNVTDMSNMFFEAKNFNQPIGRWNTSNVTDMDSMFYGAERFNQPLNKWDVSKVIHWNDFKYRSNITNENFLPKFGVIKQDNELENSKQKESTLKTEVKEISQPTKVSSNEKWTVKEVEEQKAKETDYFKQLVEKADKEIEEIFHKPEELKNFFAFATTLQNNYSSRNLMLIHQQFPGATIVKSFTEWKREDLSVKKGEKGIKIIRPLVDEYVVINNNSENQKVFKKNWTRDIWQKIKNNEIEVYEDLLGFKPANVFDIAQTNLPKEEYPEDYFKDFIDEDTAQLKFNELVLSELKLFVKEKNIELKPKASLGQARGLTATNDLGQKVIYLNEHNSTKENIATLLHEYAHIKFNHSYKTTERAECEYQAEMTAWALAKTLKVDTTENSYKYIGRWLQTSNVVDKRKWMDETISTLKVIRQELNQHILKSIETRMERKKELEEKEEKKHKQVLSLKQ